MSQRITGEPDLFREEIRAIVEEKLQESPPGGVTIYTGDGAYPENEVRTINQNGGSTIFSNSGTSGGISTNGADFYKWGNATEQVLGTPTHRIIVTINGAEYLIPALLND